MSNTSTGREIEGDNEKTPEGADSYSLRLNGSSIPDRHLIRQEILDILEKCQHQTNEELMKLHIEATEDRLLALIASHTNAARIDELNRFVAQLDNNHGNMPIGTPSQYVAEQMLLRVNELNRIQKESEQSIKNTMEER